MTWKRDLFICHGKIICEHFLTLFVALLLIRLLQRCLDKRYSAKVILDSLNSASCSLMQRNYYIFDYYDEVLQSIGQRMGIDFSKKYRSLGEIKKVLGLLEKVILQ